MASIPGRDVVPSKAPADPTAAHNMTRAMAAAWPKGGSAEVAVPPGGATFAKSSSLPVAVAAASEAPAPGRVQVDVLHQDGLPRGVVPLRVKAVDGPDSQVRLRVDYRAFAQAYGAGYGSRLRLTSLSGCAAPGDPGCVRRELSTVNDRAARLLTAPVEATKAGTMVVVESAPSSDGGNYAATPLSATATWSAGGNSGDFSWSYPLRMPPSLGGPAPQIALSYSAQSVDGRTAANNNQPSWIGEGFGYHPGSITRSYKACADDGTPGVGDMCWGSDNAMLSMSGRGGELIRVAGGADVWRLRNDDGTRVERLTGASNGDNDGEHWKVTTTDGTQFFFGLNRLPGWTTGKPVTGSAWTVPVFGNAVGEPCNAATFAASHCSQAYQWNLDYIVDPHGNSMSLWYSTETSNYARNRTDTAVSAYVRGGWLARVDYGTRQDGGVDSALTSAPAQRVVFTVRDRCVVQGPTCTPATPANWPDVPWDRQCDSATSCPGKYAPAFYTQKMLSTVTTQVAAGTGHRDVETWTLDHVFKDPGDGHDKILWLNRIGHTGKAGGTTTAMPDVVLDAVHRGNRVDTSPTKNPIVRYRLSSITDEYGGVTAVTYSPADCALGSNMPSSPDNNTKRCFPVRWTPYGTSAPTLDWFHKYVVTNVTVTDRAGGGSKAVESAYTYSGAPAWHYDEGEFVPDAHKTWGQWRGYGRVRVVRGAADDTRSQTDTVYFRGMHGDRLASGTRTVTLPADPDFGGPAINDEPWRQGQIRETIDYNGVGDDAPVLAKTLNEPWEHGPHASRTRGGTTVHAYTTGVKSTTAKTALDGGRGWRTTKVTNTFDHDAGAANPTGRVVAVDDAGDTALTTDDRCTRTTYAANAAAHLLTSPVQVETVAVGCGTAPDRSRHVLSDVRTYYDGAAAFGTSIGKGDVTRTERLADWNAGSPRYTPIGRSSYDAYGRILESYDALDRRTSASYTSGASSTISATNPMRWTPTVTTIDPAFGAPTSVVDANGRRTDMTYDGLGRLTAVWLPGRDKATQTASRTYSYTAAGEDWPTSVATSTLNTSGTGYLTAHTLYDGLLRARQTQRPAPGGGRIITDVMYDSRGNAVLNNHDYHNNASPGGVLYKPDEPVPGRTLTTYDHASRPTVSAFQVNNAERWRTTTAYGGDRTDVNVPAGGNATSTWTDARGNVRELRQYHGSTVGGTYDTTRYGYTPDGKRETVTDPAGNVWRYQYDQRRRTTSAHDPDKGTVTYTYDDADQLASATNARGVTMNMTYDALGRMTGVYQGAVTPANQRAEWTFDTLGDGTAVKGEPVKSVRYADGSAYVTEVTGYDAAYRRTGVSVTIPAAEGSLAGTYRASTTYNPDGSIADTTLPAAGGLPAETLTNTYNAVGLPATLSGINTYVSQTHYDSLGRVGDMEMTDGGGKTLSQVWNYEAGTGRLFQHGVLDRIAQTLYQDARYTRDDAGNVTSIKDLTSQYGAGPDDNQCLRYDHLARLKDAWTPADGNCAAAPATSALGGPAPYRRSWTYDAIGNRLSETEHTASGNVTRAFTYPAPGTGQPHTLRKLVTTRPGGGTATDTYTYDEVGSTKTRNLAGKPGQTLEWNAEGHLASITEGGATTRYLYDADGNRLMAKDSGGATLYLPGQEVRRTGTTVTATRYYGSNAARTTAGGLIWTVNDHHGTNSFTFNASTLADTRRRTTPFGTVRGQTPAWPTTKGFVGGTDDPTGLVHVGAREYDANTGRFISDDPITDHADPQQMNGYAYSNNTPATASDPSGLKLAYEGGHRRGCTGTPDRCADQSGQNGGRNGGGSTGNPACVGATPSSRSASCQEDKGQDNPITETIIFGKHGTVLMIFENGRASINGYLLPEGFPGDPRELAAALDEMDLEIDESTEDPIEALKNATKTARALLWVCHQNCHTEKGTKWKDKVSTDIGLLEDIIRPGAHRLCKDRMQDENYAQCESAMQHFRNVKNDPFWQGCVQKVKDHWVADVAGAALMRSVPHIAWGPAAVSCVMGGTAKLGH
ncbi:RHS repeat-associated core domain-containing protein [Rhizohabitans arisaemae]|uniref:RHS repeat-associated core domain-containing protein n=1 Tax=Rhizohabitans arisaemae TaxID=2720610 RepID=UPI0024B1790D|nr:RHS repeat-associated core domain-containing protein [Rhizohabitans arisaemae]